jgi:hypothetical protein
MLSRIAIFCARTQFLDRVKGLKWLKKIVRRKESFWLMGFSTCLSLLVEEKVSLVILRYISVDSADERTETTRRTGYA